MEVIKKSDDGYWRGYTFNVPDGEFPWYHEFVYRAYINVLEKAIERGNKIKPLSSYHREILTALSGNQEFRKLNEQFYLNNKWKYNGYATSRTIHWYDHDTIYNIFPNTPFSRTKIRAFINKSKPAPCTDELLADIRRELTNIVLLNPQTYSTIFSADADVFIGLRKAGKNISYPVVRSVIKWLGSVEPDLFDELRPATNVDLVMSITEATSGLSTSHNIEPGRPTGDFGSTQAPTKRP